jgi:hypothetical protein
MVDELRKAELVRDWLEGLDQIARSYPEGHDERVLIENLQLERVLGSVEEGIRTLRDAFSTLVVPEKHIGLARRPFLRC